MLKVTIELVSAITGATSEIGRMYIANDGKRSSADPKLGDYLVAVCRRGTEEVPRELYEAEPRNPEQMKLIAGQPKATRAGSVREYPRLAYNVWRLITRACLAAFPEEHPRGYGSTKIGKNVKPVLDEQVMRGLKLIASPVNVENAAVMNASRYEHSAIMAAREWLDAALAEAGAVPR